VRDVLDGHVRLLLAWTTAINLTAIRDPAGVARLHVLDSLVAVSLLAPRGATGILDLGSGGGFPGLPLAAVLAPARTLLVDSIAKKVVFLRTVVEATGLEGRVAAEAVRAEALARDPRDRERWPVVTARAVTSLAELVEIGLPLVAPGGVLVAWKRSPMEAELAAAAPTLAALRAGNVTVRHPGPRGAPAGRRPTPRPHRRAVPARPCRASPASPVNSGPVAGPCCATLPGMRVAVLSDIHANLPALDAVLAAMPSVDEVWQLGDVVGYGPEPDDVVARLREIGALGVRGNHDAAALGGPEIESFNVDARNAMLWTRATINDETRAWLGALPERLVRAGFTLVHGSPRDPIWEYVTSTPVARAGIAAMETAGGLHGHTHIPIAYLEDDGRLETMSPGSGGQPRDGIPAASWLILDTEAGSATWQRTAYDVAGVQREMSRFSLPERLVARLAYGL